MTARCPLCSTQLEPTLANRIIEILTKRQGLAGVATSSGVLVKETGKSKPLVMQALRRLESRGAVRRVPLPAPQNSGWEITPDLSLPEGDTPQIDADKLANAGRELAGYVGAVQRLPEDAATQFLERIGLTRAEADLVINTEISVGRLSRGDVTGDLHLAR